MHNFKIVKGDLIELAKQGEFDVISHGCNCWCVMASGIAPIMDNNFDCGAFALERRKFRGVINKLGQIDYEFNDQFNIYVVNSYTQYAPGTPDPITDIPLNYSALEMCMRKIGHIFKGKRIGLPWIGCGLAGGDKLEVEVIIRQELKDCDVTIVEL